MKYRRIHLQLYESCYLKRVEVALQVDFEAILKLQRKVEFYSERRLQNVLPLFIFDDYTNECLKIQTEILRRRKGGIPPVTCVVTMKDENEKRFQDSGDVLDYDWRQQEFIVEVDGKRYFMNRLCIQFEDFESKAELEERRV